MKKQKNSQNQIKKKKVYLRVVEVLLLVMLFVFLAGKHSVDGVQYTEDINLFPLSYRAALYEIKKAHPNWVFEMYDTHLSWDTVVDNETNPANRSLVPSYFSQEMVGDYYGDGWSCATRSAVEYYLDPRNWLNEKYIFQFEKLTYNEDAQSIVAMNKLLSNSFMSGFIQGYENEGITYATAFYNIGKSLGVSPVHLAARVLQEQGTQGTSELISGTVSGYEGYYNYYNIQATGKDRDEIVRNGLNEAVSECWNSRYEALYGGSNKLANRYILRGQDTLYFQKFDVDGTYDGRYWHQYMQNLAAPSNEGYNVKRAYEKAGVLDQKFVFKIPVYDDMPGMANEVSNFVKRLYQVVLGRNCNETEMQGWYNALMNNENTCTETAYGFIFSSEYISKRQSNADFIAMLYKALLNRNPAESEVNEWLRAFDNGYSRKYIFQQFATAPEFAKLCERYGGLTVGKIDVPEAEVYASDEEKLYYSTPASTDVSNAGSADPNEGAEGFVRRLYRNVLGRECSDSEMKGWKDSLINQSRTCTETAYGFVFSEEYLKKNTSNADFIKMLYATLLNRTPAQSEVDEWLKAFDQGYSRKYLFQQYSTAPEFAKLCNRYSLVVGSIDVPESEKYGNNTVIIPSQSNTADTSNSTEQNVANTPVSMQQIQNFVSRLYTHILQRNCNDEERQGWCNGIANREITASDVVRGFVTSEEFVKCNKTDDEYLRILYRALFGREPGESEVQGWLGYMSEGHDRNAVLDGFIQSDEFKALLQSYGL